MQAIGWWIWWMAAAALGALTVSAGLPTHRPLRVAGISRRVAMAVAGRRRAAAVGDVVLTLRPHVEIGAPEDGATRPAGPGRGA